MKVAVILTSLARKAPVLVAKDIISQIYDKVEKIDVYYFDDIVEVDFNCPVHKIDFSTEIDFSNYDIIHSHMYRTDKYLWKNRSRIKGKIISTVHCHIEENFRYEYNVFVSIIFTWIWFMFLRCFDKIVVLTNSVLDNYYKHHIQNNKLVYIYNGINIPVIESIDNANIKLINDLKENKYKIIGSNAALTKRKGLHKIISVLPSLCDYVFIVLGDGKEKRNLIRLAKKMGVSDRCYFLGFKKNAISFLQFYDVYAMPSISEGFSLALTEATLSKCSCVCSDIPVFTEIFTNDEVTFFDLRKKNTLINAIQEAYEKRIEKGERAYERVVKNYTVEIMGEKYLDTYKSLLKS